VKIDEVAMKRPGTPAAPVNPFGPPGPVRPVNPMLPAEPAGPAEAVRAVAPTLKASPYLKEEFANSDSKILLARIREDKERTKSIYERDRPDRDAV